MNQWKATSLTASTDHRLWFRHWPDGVPRTLGYPAITLDGLLSDAATNHPDVRATIYRGETLTYGQLNEFVDSFSAGLHEIGVGKGDRVSVLMANCPQAVIVYFGILRAGGVIVQTDGMLSPKEIADLDVDTGTETAVVLDALLEKTFLATKRAQLKRLVIVPSDEWMPRGDSSSGHAERLTVDPGLPAYDFKGLLRGEGQKSTDSGACPDDVAVLQQTGGTTGIPKCAMLTHANLIANACQTAAWLPDGKPGREAFLSVIPFSHAYGLTTALFTPVKLAAAMVMRTGSGGVSEILALAEQRGVTIFPGVPALFSAIVRSSEVGRHDLSSLRICISGSEPLRPELQAEFEKTTHVHLVEGYGLSEASPVTHCNPFFGMSKEGIGIPYPDTDAKILDLDKGADEMGVEQVGELAVSGPQVMKGYWGRPDETAKVLRGKWLLTGDIATMDEDGFFHIIDRKKDMLISSGYKVYPREVEKIICEHPSVKECAVIGIADDRHGMTPKAYVVLKGDSVEARKNLVAFCEENLAEWKRPTSYSFMESLPKSPLGKVLKKSLRDDTFAACRSPDGVSGQRTLV